MDRGWLRLGVGTLVAACIYAIFIQEIIGLIGWILVGVLEIRIGLGLNTMDNDVRGHVEVKET